MPTFGGLLKKKKTKESDEKSTQQSGGSSYQPIQYKSSQKTDTSSNPSSKPTTGASEATTNSNAPTVTTTSTPDPHVKNVESNGGPNPNMNSVPVANESGGVAESKPVQRQTKGKYTLTDFQIQRTLGTGSFGRVHLVQSKHNQRYYAIKVLKKAQVVKMKQIEHTNDERKMLQRVKHPFLITLWGTFQDSKNLYMVMDFIEGGELFSLLRKSQVGRVQR
jgi:protein kinase A